MAPEGTCRGKVGGSPQGVARASRAGEVAAFSMAGRFSTAMHPAGMDGIAGRGGGARVIRTNPDERFMKEALRCARSAARRAEVPVGAVVVLENRIVARAGNATVSRKDPTAHAEVVALRRCARRVGNHRLPGAVLYVTLEPCVMCLGAMVQARIARCVFAARDPKVGAARLMRQPALRQGLNHRFEVTGGILAEESSGLLRSFFRERRRGLRTAAGARLDAGRRRT